MHAPSDDEAPLRFTPYLLGVWIVVVMLLAFGLGGAVAMRVGGCTP